MKERAEELAEGHEVNKGYAKLAHSELRAQGVTRFRDKAGREYWISEQKLQIVLPDNSEVHYNTESDSLSIKGAGEREFVGYTEFTGDFAPYINALGMAQTVALSEHPEEQGEVLARLHEGRGDTSGAVSQVLHS